MMKKLTMMIMLTAALGALSACNGKKTNGYGDSTSTTTDSSMSGNMNNGSGSQDSSSRDSSNRMTDTTKRP